jgi:LysM repeat protein
MYRGRHAKPKPPSKVSKTAATGVIATGAVIAGSVPALASTYTVHSGDTLSQIAQSHCGKASDWQGIYAANRKVIGSDPNLILTGQRLSLSCKAPAKAAVVIVPATASSAAVVASSDNYLTIAKFLVAHGYSRAAAAGIVACIAGESAGNPESEGDGGGGLIGWTPLPAGYVTGNPTADLNKQLSEILVYNSRFGSAVSTLNIIPSAVAAADYYSQEFERPAVTDSDVRASVADSIFSLL